jgi:hypothetical protein
MNVKINRFIIMVMNVNMNKNMDMDMDEDIDNDTDRLLLLKCRNARLSDIQSVRYWNEKN